MTSATTHSVLDVVFGFFGLFGGIGTIATLVGVATKVTVAQSAAGSTLTVAGVSVSVGLVAVLAAALTALAIFVLIAMYRWDRCIHSAGSSECVAGAVHQVKNSFTAFWDNAFPFTAMHDRVDVIVKEPFFDVVEDGNAYVHCTDTDRPRRSPVMRAYYFSEQVCSASLGSMYGAVVGGVAAIVAGAIIAAAIACVHPLTCVVVIIVIAVVAAILTLTGALVGGQAAKASTPRNVPAADAGDAIVVGQYLSVHGNMKKRDEDSGANVLWWEQGTSLHGKASESLRRPLNHCEIEADGFEADSCPRA